MPPNWPKILSRTHRECPVPFIDDAFSIRARVPLGRIKRNDGTLINRRQKNQKTLSGDKSCCYCCRPRSVVGTRRIPASPFSVFKDTTLQGHGYPYRLYALVGRVCGRCQFFGSTRYVVTLIRTIFCGNPLAWDYTRIDIQYSSMLFDVLCGSCNAEKKKSRNLKRDFSL